MDEKKIPPMIWVMLDESIPQGTHEFADSVNNGPWGSALTTEFIPYLERKYRMDARTSGRVFKRPLERRLGYAAAPDQLSAGVWWHVVHFARPERLSRFYGCRSLCSSRKRLPEAGRLAGPDHPG